MSAGRATLERKTRARTGCLTCRTRRRKCDERKPRCQACEARSLSCIYPGLTFLSSPLSSPLGVNNPLELNRSNYRLITFADDVDREPGPKSQTVPNDGASRRSIGTQTQDAPATVVLNSSIGPRLAEQSPACSRPRSQSTWDSFFGSTDGLSLRGEAGLSLHFRYNIVPWIEAGNLDSSFSSSIMQYADQKTPIFEAIILLALRQLESASTTVTSSVIERCLAIRRKVKAEIANADSETAAIGEALLALEEFLRLAPAQWSSFQFPRLNDISPDLSLQHPTEPLKTLIRLQCRIVLAKSILTRKRPPSYVKSQLTSINQYVTLPQSPSIALLDGCLCLLADCLLANTDIEVTPGPAESWLRLWTKCQQWYEGRPPWAQPILDIRPLEARQIDTETFSSFPIEIYTTTIALLSNAIYHITSLLLLLRKPRLSIVPTQDRHLTSLTWHAQQIAGIATRNNFKDQWDPILIAGLLLISKDMTNKAQQDTLLECFGKISDATGIRLDRETGELRSHWAILRGGN